MSTRKKVWREVCGSTAIPHAAFLAQSFSSPSSVVIWSASSSSFPLKASPSSCLGVYWLWPGPCPWPMLHTAVCVRTGESCVPDKSKCDCFSRKINTLRFRIGFCLRTMWCA